MGAIDRDGACPVLSSGDPASFSIAESAEFLKFKMATSSKNELGFNVRFSSEEAKEAFFTDVSFVKNLLDPERGDDLSNLDMMTALFALVKLKGSRKGALPRTMQHTPFHFPSPTPLPPIKTETQSFFTPSDTKPATPSPFFVCESEGACMH